MKKIDLGQAFTILANSRVIAGVVFLAVELDQKHEAIAEQNTINRLTAEEGAFEAFNSSRTLLLEQPDLLRILIAGEADEQLTPFEQRQFGLLCQDLIWRRAILYERFAALSLAQEAQALVESARSEANRSSYWRTCWDDSSGPLSARGFGSYVKQVDEG
jgi:hypothetical protein